MLSAHSTAVMAAMRKLSAAAHSQIPLGRATSLFNETRMLAWPAVFTLLGCDSSSVSRQRHVISSKGLRQPLLIDGVLHLQKNGQRIAMKNWGLKHHQCGLRRFRSGNLLIVAAYACLRANPARASGFLPVARNHVERHLLIEQILRQRLE